MPQRDLMVPGTVTTFDAQDGKPAHFSGLAIPYNTVIDVMMGKETFKKGAFKQQAASVNKGERLAYLTRHGDDGGEISGVITSLSEEDDGLHFSGDWLDNDYASKSQSHINAGINGVSAEVIPGKWTMKGDVREHLSDVRLAGIAGSYAPAFVQARVALHDVARKPQKGFDMPTLSLEALTQRRDALANEESTIRALAEAEGRDLSHEDHDALTALNGRKTNIEALMLSAKAEAERRDAERNALPSGDVSRIRETRSETVYGPGKGVSFFRDLVAMRFDGDREAQDRMQRHRKLVTDLAVQIESHSIESSELAGAYPTGYYPDLYVPDTNYTGPLATFFAETPIAAPTPLVVPSFSSVTGDTGVQATENTALANVDVATAPISITPKTIGGEAIVARQAVDGASPGVDTIVANELNELLMRDREREIAAVLEALTSSGAIADTAGTGSAQSGRDLVRGIKTIAAAYYAGAAAGGAGARFLPPEGWFANSTDWGNLVNGEDANSRPLLPFINPMNADGQLLSTAFQRGVLGGVPIEPAWSFLSATSHVIARRNDARQWISALRDFRLEERNGPQSIVFAVMQYFAFAVIQPKGVRRYTYTNA